MTETMSTRATLHKLTTHPAARLRENRAVVRRLYEEVWNGGKLAAADEILAPDCVGHDPFFAPEPGPEGAKRLVRAFRAAFPGAQISIEEQVAEGDRVATRWTVRGDRTDGLPDVVPTGEREEVAGISIHRVSAGKIAESWDGWDTLGLTEQLGLIGRPPA